MLSHKVCAKCRTDKPAQEFHKKIRACGGLASRCKSCLKDDRSVYFSNPENRKKSRDMKKAWNARNPEERKRFNELRRVKLRTSLEMLKKYRDQRIKYMYGLTPERLEKLIALQNNSCAICGVSFHQKKMFIDHSHEHKYTRGLLCLHCNSGIGFLKESEAIMSSAIEYIKYWEII